MRKKIFGYFCLMLLVIPQGTPLNAALDVPWNLAFGTASWYSESDAGINLQTASGEIFDDTRSTCASWDFPFGTRLEVTNLRNGRSVICRVNDRGPAKKLGRLIDLTKGAFQQIAPLRSGLIHVQIKVVE